MAVRMAQKHVRDVNDLGELPFRLVKGIVDAVQSPQQLLAIQKASPHIAQHTGYKWLEFLKRDIKSWDGKSHLPASEDQWWQTYKQVRQDYDNKLLEAEALLVKSNAAQAALKMQNKAHYESTPLFAIDDTKWVKRSIPAPGSSIKSTFMRSVMKESSKVQQSRPQKPIPRWKRSTASNSSEQPAPAACRRGFSMTTARALSNEAGAKYYREHGAETVATREREVKETRAKILAELDTLSPRKSPLDAEAAIRDGPGRLSSPSSTTSSEREEALATAKARGEPAPLYTAVTPTAKRVRAEPSCFIPKKRVRRS